MPGILPMKVIKIGTSTQSRIAQACDRCRSKKIRCDGLRPCCTQCSSVGFECKTSDKLSRRAFPRGYTESLEERVRVLETEVRELKDLLDEKDEKIDMLSKINSQSPRKLSTLPLTLPASASTVVVSEFKDVLKVSQPHTLIAGTNTEAYFMGSSSTRAFVDAFAIKAQEHNRSSSALAADKLLALRPHSSTSSGLEDSEAPPRLLSDQMVNIFLQEWLPLFPVLHRPTFLALYEKYVSNEADIKDKGSLAILNLVFGIATLSSERRFSYDISSCEAQWVPVLDSLTTENSLLNLQCLILAQIFYLQKGDYSRLLQYKSVAVGMAQRLGLHTSQKRYVFDVLTSETRKKVFWTLYTLDCYSAAVLGLPRSLRDDNIECEYPVDADDENVTRKGFRPGVPGESTKLSSALALFRGARILGKVLEQNYTVTACKGLSLQTIANLNDELDSWNSSLAPHLKLEFVKDKPCTNVISSRCPLLSLMYHYTRTLIHRPAVCSNLGDKGHTSAVALASSSKCIIQILELLEERSLSFSFCLNKQELLVLSGLGVLLQAMDLDKSGKLIQDSQKTTQIVVSMLEQDYSTGGSAAAFKEVTTVMGHSIPVKRETPPVDHSQSLPALPAHLGFAQKQLQAIAARYTLSTSTTPKQPTAREPHRASMPSLPVSQTQQNLLKAQLYAIQSGNRHPPPSLSRATTTGQFTPQNTMSPPQINPTTVEFSNPSVNLDYFVFPEESSSPKRSRNSPDLLMTELDPLFSQEWPQPVATANSPAKTNRKLHISDDALLESLSWPSTSWDFDTTTTAATTLEDTSFYYPNSVPSLSGDSFSEEQSSSGRGSVGNAEDAFASITIPDFSLLDDDGFDTFRDTLTL